MTARGPGDVAAHHPGVVLPAVRVASARAAAGALAPGAAARAAVANGRRVQSTHSPTKQTSLQIVIVAAKG